MLQRRAIEVGALVWAAVGVVVGLGTVAAANADARALVLAACVVGSVAAVVAAQRIAVGHDRQAGALLVLSLVTPTVFAWILGLPALIVGVLLVARPAFVVRPRAGPAG